MNNFAKHLSEHLKNTGTTKYRLSKLADVPESTINHLCSGKRRPTDDVLNRISMVPELNLSEITLQSWRLSDDYDIEAVIEVALQQLKQDPALSQFVLALKQTPEAGDNEKLLPLILKILNENKLLPSLINACQNTTLALEKPGSFKRLECRGLVSAGKLTFSNTPEDITYHDWVDVPAEDNLFCLKVQGDSMSPMIPDGAVLLVKPAEQLRSGGVYVIETEDKQTTCKLVEVSSNGLTLLPVNPNYNDIPVSQFNIANAYEVLEYKVSLV